MTGIAFKGLAETPPATSRATDLTALALEPDAFRERVLWRYRGAERRTRMDRLGSLVQAGLDLRLTALERAAQTVRDGAGAPGLERAAGVRTLLEAAGDLDSFLTDHADLLEPGLAARAGAPLADRAAELDRLGIARQGADGAWTLDRPAFLEALAADPGGVDAALGAAPDGLAPALLTQAEAIRAPGLDTRLANAAGLADLGPPVGREVANMERATLLDVVEAAPLVAEPRQGDAPRRAGAAGSPELPELGPGLLRGSA